MAGKSQRTFGQGAEGFGKYYWHVFVDGGIENYQWVEIRQSDFEDTGLEGFWEI